jgi:hypothetical protein
MNYAVQAAEFGIRWVCQAPQSLALLCQTMLDRNYAKNTNAPSRVFAGVWMLVLALVIALSTAWPGAHMDWAFWLLSAPMVVASIIRSAMAPAFTERLSTITTIIAGVWIQSCFDIANVWDWLSLGAIVVDPLLMAAAGATTFGYNVTLVDPQPRAEFPFAAASSGSIMMTLENLNSLGLGLSLFCVAVHTLLQCQPANSRLRRFTSVTTAPIILIVVHCILAVQRISPAMLFPLLIYLPTCLLYDPPPQSVPWYTNTRFNSKFVIYDRILKVFAAIVCPALAATGHDVAQAGVSVTFNVLLGGMLLSSETCTIPFVSRTRALGHGFSTVAVATSIAVRYGAPSAETFGWGALLTILFLYSVMCCCSNPDRPPPITPSMISPQV